MRSLGQYGRADREDLAVEDVENVYGRRFSDAEAAKKDRMWREITRYLQRYIDPAGVVLDIGCDRGDFIRNISAAEKWAADVRDVSPHLTADVNFVRASGLALRGELPHGYFDVVFMSNYLEHLPSTDAVIEQLRAARDLLRPNGKIVILQPNIRLVGGSYWDFIDHKVALTERSLREAAELAGYLPERTITRFLPYTTKTRLPQAPLLLRAYLALPPAWLLFGKQSLFIARRT